MSRLKRNMVKEAVDNLPSGVCFFDRNGLVTLCNHQMYRLIYDLTGRDLQSYRDICELREGYFPCRREGDLYLTCDGRAWRFSEEKIKSKKGRTYIQVTASDITEIYSRQKELEEDNRKLEEYAVRMKRLSVSIAGMIHDEEVLNMKIRVHDEIGRRLIATKQYLVSEDPADEPDLSHWKGVLRMLRHENEEAGEDDLLAGFEASAKAIGIRVITCGSLPESRRAGGILSTAVHECMTNAVRHAGADTLYVNLEKEGGVMTAEISNNGAAPLSEIVEGGGLSSLRMRVTRQGGTMRIESSPGFRLVMSVPDTDGGIYP